MQALSASNAPAQVAERDPNRVLSVSPVQQGILPPVTITCGDAQILQHIELPSAEVSRTIVSLSLLLATEQQSRPHLDIATLKVVLLQRYERQAPGQFEDSKAPSLQIVCPVPVTMNVDGVDLRFKQ